jgi:hypothetical protein
MNESLLKWLAIAPASLYVATRVYHMFQTTPDERVHRSIPSTLPSPHHSIKVLEYNVLADCYTTDVHL